MSIKNLEKKKHVRFNEFINIVSTDKMPFEIDVTKCLVPYWRPLPAYATDGSSIRDQGFDSAHNGTINRPHHTVTAFHDIF